MFLPKELLKFLKVLRHCDFLFIKADFFFNMNCKSNINTIQN
jgi:hypothetical protein